MTKPMQPPMDMLARALAAGGITVHRALERLLSPARIIAGPMKKLDVQALERAVAVRFCIHDRPQTKLLLLTEERAGASIASVLLRRRRTGLDEEARQALAELANIAASSFLNGLSRTARLKLLPSIPVVETLDSLAAQQVFATLGVHAYEARFDIVLPDGPVKTTFIAAADDESLEELLGLMARPR